MIIACMTTRVVHLELTKNQTAESIITAWEKFTLQRGIWPAYVLSDGARGLIKAREVISERAEKHLGRRPGDRFKWEISHPRAPHRQGVIESLIRLVKESIKTSFDLRQKTSKAKEEWDLLLCQITYIMNSRPLTSEEKAWEALPLDGNWILHPYLEESNNPSTSEIIKLAKDCLKRFWDNWYRSVIPALFVYPKWNEQKPNLEVNDVVLVTKPSFGQGISERGKWPRGIIRETTKSKDGVVRKVVIEYESGKRESQVVQNIIRWAPVEMAIRESLIDQFKN